jgi:hypothetical protein
MSAHEKGTPDFLLCSSLVKTFDAPRTHSVICNTTVVKSRLLRVTVVTLGATTATE